MTPAKREKTAVESFKRATETIGKLVPGASVFGVTRGQISMIDLILACLDQTGPAAVSVWTWCIADYEVKCFERLMMDRRITSGLLVVDSGARAKNGEQLKRWMARFGAGSVKWVVNHAKLATVEGAGLKLLLRGSMNLNFNPRFEQFDLDEGHPGFNLVRKIEGELPALAYGHSWWEAKAVTGVVDAFTEEELLPFGGTKVWSK